LRSHRWAGLAPAVVLVVMALTGCSATTTAPPTPAPTPVVVTPSQGRPLSAWGPTQGPSDLIWLPGEAAVTYTADQPNLVIASGPADQAGLVGDYLRRTLPGLGWEITADANGALMFEQGEWQGAFVTGEDTWALTARND